MAARAIQVSVEGTRNRRADAASYLVLGVAAFLSIAPFFFLLATSLAHTFSQRVKLRVLKHPTFSNYVDVLTQTSFGHWLVNSLVVAGVTSIVMLFIDSLAGYAFAKKRFAGRDTIFFMLLATLMIPLPVTILPTFLLANRLGLIDSYPALILPVLAGPIGVFMMRQFIQTIPNELEEAARMDGLGDFAIYWRIILPLSVPALALLGFYTFFFQWSSLLWPLIVATSDRSRTTPPGLATWVGQYSTDYGLISAGAVLSIVPMVVVFFALARYLAQGLVARTVKG